MSYQGIVFKSLFVLFLSGDALTKWAAYYFFQNSPQKVLPFLSLIYQRNPGIAFGIEIDSALLLILNIFLFFLVLFLGQKHLNLKSPLAHLAFTLLVAGAMGNLIERIIFSSVTDFISIGSFPVFNLADLYISVSVFIIVLFYDKIKRNTNSYADLSK